MKLHYSGFQGLQLGEVFGQGLGVVYGEAGISTCAGRPWEILQHILQVGILHVGLLPKLVFLSAGTCVVGPQAGLVVVPVEEFVAWMVLALPGVAKLSRRRSSKVWSICLSESCEGSKPAKPKIWCLS